MNKCGRKKIVCTLGEKKNYTYSLYGIEKQQMDIYFKKLKRERPRYYIYEEQEDTK